MARVSNGIITFVNILTLVVGFAAVGLSISLHVRPDSDCQKVLRTPLLAVGVALLVVSLIGLAGSCCRFSFFMFFYLFVLFVLILGLMAFSVFAIIVTNKGVGAALSGQGVGDTRLGDYSRWLQRHVVNAENWGEIKSCLWDVKLCQNIKGGMAEDYYKTQLTPIQSGCCKPPNYCGMQFHNATYWTMPKSGPAVSDPDCTTWSNEEKQLCFDCESCKRAMLDDIKKEWRMLAIINFCILVLVIIVYSIGCCALRNNRNGSGYQKYAPYP